MEQMLFESQPVMSTTMMAGETKEMPEPPATYGGMPMQRRYAQPVFERPITPEAKGYERATESYKHTLQRNYLSDIPGIQVKSKKPLPTADPKDPQPIVASLKANISEQNKIGVPYADRKPTGISRNPLGGFYTS